MMRTESTVKPAAVTVRKLGVIDGEPVVYLYLASNIIQMDTMYVNDVIQVTIQAPDELLPAIDLTLIADHGYNQTRVKQRTVKHLDKLKARLRLATARNTRQVDRLDRLSTLKPGIIKSILKVP